MLKQSASGLIEPVKRRSIPDSDVSPTTRTAFLSILRGEGLLRGLCGPSKFSRAKIVFLRSDREA